MMFTQVYTASDNSSALIIAVPSAFFVGVIGTIVGLVSGYYGEVVDAVSQRISITFLVWPSIPLVAFIVFSWRPSNALLLYVSFIDSMVRYGRYGLVECIATFIGYFIYCFIILFNHPGIGRIHEKNIFTDLNYISHF
ncbi:MAG: hypothetical protein HXS40_12600 [Theionarchaea archaeon]|nr:hypothetical protein [Theionarchaea archaeon]